MTLLASIFILGVMSLDLAEGGGSPPRFRGDLRTITKQWTTIGKSTKLLCIIQNKRKIEKYTWYKDGKIINIAKNVRMRVKFGKYLKIKNIRKEDAGKYRCEVKNRYGKINAAFILNVGERIRARPILEPIANTTVFQGQNATLECLALSDSVPHFQWLKWNSNATGNSGNLKSRKKYKVVKQSNYDHIQHLLRPKTKGRFAPHGVRLTLVNVTKKEEGKYTCLVGNSMGYDVTHTYVIVRDPSNVAPPRFLDDQKTKKTSIAVSVGSIIRMDCSAIGIPNPTIVWYRNGRVFNERGGQPLDQDPHRHVITLKDAVPRDSGKYTCNVTNAYGWIKHTYIVDVQERIRARPILQPIANTTVFQGQNATLECLALSDSVPHFQWLKWYSKSTANSGKMKSGKKYKVIDQSNHEHNQHLLKPKTQRAFVPHSVRLTLVNVTKKDEGKYTCLVGNSVGYDVTYTYVIVRDPPNVENKGVRPVLQPIANMTVSQGKNVTLECLALSDSVPQFQWLKWYSKPSQQAGNSEALNCRSNYEVLKQNNYDHSQQKFQRPFAPFVFKLSLVNVTKKDKGKYTCTVGSSKGYDVSHTYVIVRNPRNMGVP